MLIASLIEFLIARPRWQKHNIHLANFDLSTFVCYAVSLSPLLGLPAHRNEQRRERPKLPRQMSPNETGDCSFVRFSEIALVSMHFDHVASVIISADHSGV
ncbi:MAG: hypothetical protein DME64_13465 [Verrucomicrobia bacterium]|nr:MAG: hypothetical protein DME64_13465 [Verrucomicrobiota bacterium]